jgi:serine/threonine protein kinase
MIYERSNFLVHNDLSLFRFEINFDVSALQIGHSIGQGSFAMVYKGKERMTGREVAMKIVRAQDQIEFDDGSGGCPDEAYR